MQVSQLHEAELIVCVQSEANVGGPDDFDSVEFQKIASLASTLARMQQIDVGRPQLLLGQLSSVL